MTAKTPYVALVDESFPDYQVLMDYMDMLGGDFSAYRTVDSRITIQ